MPAICKVKNCSEKATHKLPNTSYPTRCINHVMKGMVRHSHKQCAGEGCPKKPSFGKPGTKEAIYCADCKIHNYINVAPGECTDCTTRANFIFEGQLYCSVHAPEGREKYGFRKCPVEGCGEVASFAFPKDPTSEILCAKHKKPGMKSTKNPICNFEDCPTFANYNFPGVTPPIRCLLHKEEGMKNVTSKLCQELGCPHQPYYALPGCTVGEYCKKHKSAKMMDVRHKMCEICGIKRAVYKDDAGVTRYCTKDGKQLFPPKKGENRNANGSKSCDECGKQCNFGFKGQLATKCASHKLTGMINVKAKLCEGKHGGCDKYATWGFRYTTPTMCKFHRKPGMVNKPHIKPKCVTKGCNEIALFCKKGTFEPVLCTKHKKKGYFEMINKKCIRCSTEVPISDDQNLCEDCYKREFPEKPRKGKEVRVQEVLELNDIEYISHDETVEDGCSGRRPDFIIDCEFFSLIVEVDEEQHGNVPCECEVGRMIQLHNDYGGMPLMFIRYNPDKYTDHNGAVIRGGKQNPKREKRLIRLIDRIRDSVTVDDIVPLSAYYLFFDGDDGKDRWLNLDYFANTVAEIADKITGQKEEDEEEEDEEEEDEEEEDEEEEDEEEEDE